MNADVAHLRYSLREGVVGIGFCLTLLEFANCLNPRLSTAFFRLDVSVYIR